MSLDNANKLVAWARGQAGASYLWGGKGDLKFDPVHGLIPSPFPGTFDCSGLATSGALAVLGIDHRADWNSQTMLKVLRPCLPPDLSVFQSDQRCMFKDDPTLVGALVIYPAHVAICTGRIFRSGFYEVVEATGGDETTTEPKPGALVRVGSESHSPRARLGLRYFPGCEP